MQKIFTTYFVPLLLLFCFQQNGLSQCTSIALGADINICAGECRTLDAGPGYSGYLWSTGDTTQTLSVCSSGNYWVQVIDSTPTNLVVNGDFENGSNGFTSDYVVGPGGAWGPLSIAGSYLVTSNTDMAHNIFPSCLDHTPTGTEMLVVNGSDVVDQNVWCQTVNVCPNESYDFSVWLWNLEANNPATLSFFVNGVQLGNNFTANYSGCTWREFTGVWDANGATAANICIVNQNTSAGGNDFALDDISFTSTHIYSDSVTVTVDPCAKPTLTLIGDTICVGETGSLTAVASGGTLNYSIDWIGGGLTGVVTNGVTDPFIDIKTDTPTTTTTYTVIITDSVGDVDTATVQIIVNPLPSIEAGTDAIICEGTSTSLSASGGETYIWDNGLPATAGPHIINPLLRTTYMVIGTDVNGCVNSDTVIVDINSNPIVTASNDVTICKLESTTLGATGTINYQWKNLTTGAILSNNQLLTVSPLVNTCYEVIGIDSNGCSGTDIVCVNVGKIPLPSFDSPPVCKGEQTIFTNTSVGGTFYFWDFGDGETSNIFSPQHIYKEIGIYNTKLLVADSAGCVDSIIQETVVNYIPQPLFVGDTLQGCPPLMVNFINQTDSLDSTFFYFWNLGDGVSVSNEDTVTLIYPNTGIYSIDLTVTTPQGCSETFTRQNYIEVYPIPIADFEATPPVSDIFSPIINFTDLSLEADSWRWNFGDTRSSAKQNPSHRYRDIGIFNVSLKTTNTYGCIDSISKTIIINDVYTFYAPNVFTPDGDGINDFFFPEGNGWKEMEMLIFNRWGELIYKGDQLDSKWDGTYKGFPVHVGTYVYKIKIRDIFGEYHNSIGDVSVIK